MSGSTRAHYLLGLKAGPEAQCPEWVLGGESLPSSMEQVTRLPLEGWASPWKCPFYCVHLVAPYLKSSACCLAWPPEPKTLIHKHSSSEQILRGGATGMLYSKSRSHRWVEAQRNPSSRQCQSPGYHLVIHVGFLVIFTIPYYFVICFCTFSSVQSLICVRLFVTPWTVGCQASPSTTSSWSLHKLMSIELVMISKPSHLLSPHSHTYYHTYSYK